MPPGLFKVVVWVAAREVRATATARLAAGR
jgi:hypothetical protein